jgi:hypothetical protein
MLGAIVLCVFWGVQRTLLAQEYVSGGGGAVRVGHIPGVYGMNRPLLASFSTGSVGTIGVRVAVLVSALRAHVWVCMPLHSFRWLILSGFYAHRKHSAPCGGLFVRTRCLVARCLAACLRGGCSHSQISVSAFVFALHLACPALRTGHGRHP